MDTCCQVLGDAHARAVALADNDASPYTAPEAGRKRHDRAPGTSLLASLHRRHSRPRQTASPTPSSPTPTPT